VTDITLLFIFRSNTNYNHNKWGNFAKLILKTGERFVGKLADKIIVVSQKQKKIYADNSNVVVIPNGVDIQNSSTSVGYLNKIGVEPGGYIVAVSRFVPEKGLDLLVKAFQMIHAPYKLVIAGDADHETDYSKNLKQMIDADNRIIRTGYITGKRLNEVFTHAGLFVLPSFHEGLPIALLEAMSYGLSVLVSESRPTLKWIWQVKDILNAAMSQILKKKSSISLPIPLALMKNQFSDPGCKKPIIGLKLQTRPSKSMKRPLPDKEWEIVLEGRSGPC